MNKDKLHKIMDLCIDAKRFGHDCFLNYSGHVNTISFNIHLLGWGRENAPHYEKRVNLTYTTADDELDDIIQYLENILNTNYDDKNLKLSIYSKKADSILKFKDINIRDYELSKLLTKMESEFSIPAFKDEIFNSENPDIMNLYQNVSNERSFIKALKI
jgi:hypothetical protein